MKLARREFLSTAGALGVSPQSRALASGLVAELDKLQIIDTHEHLLSEKDRVSQPVDFFTLAGHYAMSDVISAGLSKADAERVRDPNASTAERWRLFEPHWRAARFTGYGQCLRIAMRDIYGVDDISGSSVERLNQSISAQNKPGLYRKVLKERARIEYAVLDQTYAADSIQPDPDFFVVAARFDRFVAPQGNNAIRNLEALTNSSITTLTGLKKALEKEFERTLTLGIVAVKSALAYQRELFFDEVTEADAARDFEAMMSGRGERPTGFATQVRRPYRKLEDHMFHHLLWLAGVHRLPVQVHTGLLSSNGAFIRNTDPTHLTNVFLLHPQVTFDVFHIGYPYHGELAALAKMFPNVCIDFCWAHIIAPHAAQRALDEYLETVPCNKILGFGGDYRYPELTYAHAVIARRNIAAVLARRLEEGAWTEKEAADLGRMLLRDNPGRLFPRKPQAKA